MVVVFLNNGVSIFKSDSKQEAHLPTKGDLKPTSYLCSTQKTLITAKKTQMGMVRLEIQHYVTTASNLQNRLKRSKATLRNPQINQTSSLYLKTIFQEYKQKGRLSYEPTTKSRHLGRCKSTGRIQSKPKLFPCLSQLKTQQSSLLKRNQGLISKIHYMAYTIYHL